jgi:hypothetical protein
VRSVRMLGSWLLTAFALPGALQVLSSVDSRLTFGPILERIILNFRAVSVALWHLVSIPLGIDLSGIEGVLTFYVICIAVCFRSMWMGKSEETALLRFRFFETISITAILVCVAFSANMSIWEFVCISAIFAVFVFWQIYKRDYNIQSPLAGILLIIAVIVFCFVLSSLPNPWTSDRVSESPYGSALWSALSIVIGITISVVGAKNLFFTRILVFALGIFAIDFGHRTLIPTIDTFLKGAGA